MLRCRIRIKSVVHWGLLALCVLGIFSFFTEPLFSTKRTPLHQAPPDSSPLLKVEEEDSAQRGGVPESSPVSLRAALHPHHDRLEREEEEEKKEEEDQEKDRIEGGVADDTLVQVPDARESVKEEEEREGKRSPGRLDHNVQQKNPGTGVNRGDTVAGGDENPSVVPKDKADMPVVLTGAGDIYPLPVYDWDTLRRQYFRGDAVPDDMLAMEPPQYLKRYKNPCFYLRDGKGDGDAKRDDAEGGLQAGLRLKCLPYFQLIGVDKSGTTDLWARLTQHKHVARNSGVMGKETHWWSWRRFGFDIWVRNAPIRHFDWYLSTFDAPARTIRDTAVTSGNDTMYPVITGEGSPTLFWDFTGWDLIPQNSHRTPEEALVTPSCLRHLTPDVKLILMLRNPVDRLYSEYLFLDRFRGGQHNVSSQDFHQGVLRSLDMLADCQGQRSFLACLYHKPLHMALPVRIMVGMYSVWLKQWLRVFPREQMLVLRNEDYSRDLDDHMARVFQFLGLSPLSKVEMQKVVAQKRAFQRSENDKALGDMLPETRRILSSFFQPYNKELAHLLTDHRFMWQ